VRRRYPVISEELAEQLRAVEPSLDTGGGIGGYHLRYYPCRVAMKDGELLDRVYLTEAEPWLDIWGIDPDDDPGKASVKIEDIRHIEASPHRLPAGLANKLYDAGESGMGYCVFTVVLRDGRQLPYVTGNAVDFPSLPKGVTSSDVADVLPHTADGRFRDRDARADETTAPYHWCLFRPRRRSA
jgi:hypothetical protein